MSAAVLGAGLSMAGVVDCPNEPDLAVRAKTASLILLGSVSRVEDPNHAMPKGAPEPGTSYGGTVRVVFSGREAMKGQFHQQVVFDCYQGVLGLNGCRIPKLVPGKLAAVFLAGKSSPFTLVGDADGIVYLKPDEVAAFKESVLRALGSGK